MDQTTKTNFKKNIEECVQSLYRIQAENELINEIAKQAKDKFEMKPADFKKLAKLHFEQNLEEQRDKANELFELYEEVFG